ncbi:nuclear transport factor 2 family protein [Hoyosella sp. YIM 151337]|uniref:limonene-1,2-epoxide hydrolase family protein n=1 Tax=Hoyosella sp. YIM 151337 TaxID=2992742 RepID=UPI002235FB1F|nr:limonene-1,2-epoxide hydrolase family protein [Hoyosella sp. YIM 151337]MCW4351694.1 nuclear transport factor 2 family protein [Hoyosella sp. YIM 151337]
MTSTNTGTVVEFLASLRDRHVEQALSFVTEDIVWHNVSLPKVRGRNHLQRAFSLMDRLSLRFDVQFHNVTGDDRVVLTERTDALSLGRFRCEFWVCGTFEFRDGKISVWRDYFDYAQFGGSLLRGLVGVVLPRREQFALFASRDSIMRPPARENARE